MKRIERKYGVRLAAATVFLCAAVHTYPAAGCPSSARNRILKLNKKAMEDYDLLEFESAKQSLLDAQAIARRKGCDEHSVAAKTYVNLAVLYIQGFKDEDRGKLMFRKALGISKNVQLDRQVATPKLLRIFNAVKRTLGVRVTTPRPRPDEPIPRPRPRPEEPEKPAKGLEHKPIDEAPRDSDLEVKARVGDDLKASKVLLFFKVVGQNDFQALPMKKVTEWTWKVTVPGNDMRGRSFYYYVEVRHEGKPQAASGNAASPHIIMLTNPVPRAGGPVENPFGSKGKGSDTHIKKKEKAGARFSKFYLAVCGGLNLGYVGKWPGDLSVTKPRTPGFAMGTFGGMLEFGYFLQPAMLLSIAFSLGYASSDLSERAVLGWQASARFRYVVLGAPPKSIFKFYIGGQIGGGDIYHVLELDGKQDTFRSGPGLIIGALVGIWVGTETVSGYLEVDPKGVIDFTKDVVVVEVPGGTQEVKHGAQHTFALGITAGVAFRF